MSRTTHNRLLDHEETDLDTNVVLDGALSAPASTSSGDTVHQALEDLNSAIGTGGGGLSDLVTGNDSTFDASLGSWTNSGGTLTRDTSYKMSAQTASAKFVVTTSGQYMELPISGTFTANTDYWFIFFLSNESTSSTFSIDLIAGLIGTDSNTDSLALNMFGNKPYTGNARFVAIGVRWRPTADRTGVKARLSIPVTASTTWHLGMLRVWETPLLGSVFVGDRSYVPTNNSSNNPEMRWGIDPLYGLTQNADGSIYVDDGRADSGIGFAETYSLWYTEHAAADKPQEGLNVEVGTDYIGFFIGEKDSNTVQFYADFDDYNFEFEDGATGQWKTTDGSQTSALALLHYVKAGTADPSAGGGVAAPIGATYHRDNSGAGELWLKTGSSNTAWSKFNNP